MKNKFHKYLKQKETYYKLMFSFLVMLLLPLALVMVNYIYARSLLRKENLNYQDAILQQVQLTVDERLQQMQLFALELSNDAMLNQVLSGKIENREEMNYQLWETSEHLADYAATMARQCETMVYSVNYNCLISPHYIDFRISDGLIRMDSSEMNDLLREKLLTDNYYCHYEMICGNSGESKLLLLHTMPLWSTGKKPYATICLGIDEKELFSDITEMEELDSGLICLISPNGEIAGLLGDSSLLESIRETMELDASFYEKDGASFTLSRQESKLKGWYYTSIQPEHAMVGKWNKARNVSLMLLCFVLIVGLLTVRILLRRNYEPLKELMNNLHHQTSLLKSASLDNFEEIYGEYNLISRSVQEMAHSMSALEGLMEEEKSRLQESLLMQLFRNAVTDYSRYQTALQYAGISLTFPLFRVAGIKWLQEGNVEEQVLQKMMLKERFLQAAPQSIRCVFATIDDGHLIVFLNGSGDNFEEITDALLSSVAKDMRENYDQMFWICVSQPVKGMESVPKACYSVVQAQPQAPEGGVHYLKESEQNCIIDKAIDNLVAQLQNHLATANDQAAMRYIHENLENDIRCKNASLYEAKAYCIGVLNIITGAYRVDDTEIFHVEGQPPLKLLFMCQTLDEMERLLDIVVVKVCDYVQSKQQSPTAHLTEEILAYLGANYQEESLTLTSVADHFCLTSSYLSLFFKTNTGETFLNYLTHLRMEKAKELLRTTNEPISDIAMKVGYSSANTFTRSFKKIEQITPSQYRDSNR